MWKDCLHRCVSPLPSAGRPSALMPPGPCLGLGFTKQSSFLPFVPNLHCASVSPLGSQGDLISALAQVRCWPESVSFNSRAGETFQFPHSMIFNYTFPQKTLPLLHYLSRKSEIQKASMFHS